MGINMQLLLPFVNKPEFKANLHWALVAHTCNPSYLGGRD
jgi:hypothetical protein